MFLITNILLYVLLLYECSGYISNQFFSYNSYTINSRNSNKNNKIYSDFFLLSQFLSHHNSYSYSIRANNIYSNFFISHHNSYSYSIRTNNIYSNFFISHQFISHQFISHPFISHQFISHPFISHPFISHQFISHPFISHQFISHPFISHPFISHPFISHPFISHPFISHSLELKTCNNYLSIIDSYSQTKSATIYSISNSNIISNSISNIIIKESMKMLTMISKSYNNHNSATIYSDSVIMLRTIGPTLGPSVKPSINTKEKEESFIAFTTDLSLSNVQSEYLDLTSQKSIILAQSLTMNISSDFVTFVSSSVSKLVKINKNSIKPKLTSFNLIVTTKTNIILQGKYSVFLSNPQSLFTTLSTSMTNLGLFTHNLVTISLQMNSTATASAALSSIYIFNPIIQINNTNSSVSVTPTVTLVPSISFTLKPTTSSKNSGKEDYNSSSLIIFVSCISVFVALSILYIVYLFLKRRYIRFLRRNQDNSNLLDIDKIELKFCC